MIIRNFYDENLAQASYLVGCSATGEAIIIDPSRDIQQYIDTASAQGLRINSVTETHIHADFLSGTRELSAATGATMYLSDEGDADWKYTYSSDPKVVLLKDQDLISVGNVTLRALHTPGHTPEHIAFVLIDHPVSSLPHSLFSGDFVFVGDVGRPDLLERAANIAGTMEKGARTLYRSLQKLGDLPDSVLVWPGHGAGSACGKSLGGSPVTTLGYERQSNWAFLVASEDKFVDEVLSGQPEPPYYFKEMKRLNKQGPAVLHKLPSVGRTNTTDEPLVDVRPAGEIRNASYRDSIAIPMCKSFTTWAGWVLKYDQPITLIADSQEAANRAARDLATIGLDVVKSWIHPDDLNSENFAHFQVLTTGQIDDSAFILDVRGTNERRNSQVKNSTHVPFWNLHDHLGELPTDQKMIVHCASGARSLVAYSILRKAGFQNIWELKGGIFAVQEASPELVLTN